MKVIIFALLLVSVQSFSPLGLAGKNVRLASARFAVEVEKETQAQDTQVDISSLPLPPRRRPGPFRKIRDFVSFMKNPDKFMSTRAEEFGPIFMTNMFFKPTVVLGGPLLSEFSRKELTFQVTQPALPDPFLTLHTETGLLNMDSTTEVFKEVKKLVTTSLNGKAMSKYESKIRQGIDAYVETLVTRVKNDEDIPIVPEIIDLSLQIFSDIFTGQGLSQEEIEAFTVYDAGLFAMKKKEKKFKEAEAALEFLTGVMAKRMSSNDSLFVELVAKFGMDYYNVPVGMFLMVWGGYTTTAGAILRTLISASQEVPTELGRLASDDEFRTGVLRESLRLNPAGGSGLRYSNIDFEFMGYRVPAGTPVTMDPRIGFNDNEIFVEASTFAPDRWIAVDKEMEETPSGCPFRGTALKRGLGVWFPGGAGAHKCPGIPLAEMMINIFLEAISKRFESWEPVGKVKYTFIPGKYPTKDFRMAFKVRE